MSEPTRTTAPGERLPAASAVQAAAPARPAFRWESETLAVVGG